MVLLPAMVSARAFGSLLLQVVAESDLLLLLGEDEVRVHPRPEAELVATGLTFAPGLHRDFATVSILAAKVRPFRSLQSQVSQVEVQKETIF